MAEIRGRITLDQGLDNTALAGDLRGTQFDPGIGGVTVQLFDVKGNVLDTTVTDASGNYAFTGLSAGQYAIRVPPSLGDAILARDDAVGPFASDGGFDGTDEYRWDSDVFTTRFNGVSPKNEGTSAFYHLTSNEVEPNIDVSYGFYKGGSSLGPGVTLEGSATPDGIVDGEETGEFMPVGYNDANAPTDNGGDLITEGDDVIFGNGGNDDIRAGGGDDTIDGGSGNDAILAQEGNDVIDAGTGNDFVGGGSGDDSILGGDGNDSLYGDTGNDTIEGGAGDDLIGDALPGFASGGNNQFSGGSGNDTIVGAGGNDTLDGDTGNDVIFGDALSNPNGGTFSGPRESFEWDLLSQGQADTTVVQDTGDVTVTYTRTADTEAHDSFIDNSTLLNVAGIDDGAETIDTTSSLNSSTGGIGNLGAFEWAFSEPVGNVEFNINDLDGGGLVTIRAFDESGNEIPVSLVGGSDIAIGANTATATGPFQEPNDPDTTVQVTIPGPVSRVTLEHTQVSSLNSGINITDIYFDTGFVPATDTTTGGDDVIDGGAGDDLIFGDNGSTGGGQVNLIVNGSFEDVSGLADDPFGFVGIGAIPGWTTADPNDRIEVYNVNPEASQPASDGLNALDLEGSAGNIRIGQNVQNLVAGESYQLNFDVTDSQSLTADGPDENVVDVFFGGELIATIDPSNIGESEFETISPTLVAGSGDGSDRLEFQGRGVEDNIGVGLDNVQLFALTPAGEAAALGAFGGDDLIDGGEGADSIFGQQGDDTIDGGAGNDIIFGDNGTTGDTGGPADPTLVDVTPVAGADQSFFVWSLSDATIVNAPGNDDPFDNDSIGEDDVAGSTLTLLSGATPTTVGVTDNDSLFTDGDNGQQLVEGVTLNGTFVPAGETLEIEYSYSVQDSSGNVINIFAVEEGSSEVVGFISDQPLTLGETYTFIERTSTDPEIPYSNIATSFIDPDAVIAPPTGGGDDGVGGADVITGGEGADSLFGEGGDDTFIVSSAAEGAGDVIDGGNGPDETTDLDTLDLRGAGPVTIDDVTDENDAGATRGTVTFDNGATLTFEGIEQILVDDAGPLPNGVVDGEETGEGMGVGYDDSNAPTDGGGDQITNGDDVIEGNGGDDSIDSGLGNDTVDGGTGDDQIRGVDGNDSLSGGEGEDYVDGGAGDDTLSGGADNDTVVGDAGRDVLSGDDGDDFVGGGNDDDTVSGGAGNDSVAGDAGNDLLTGDAGDDTLLGGTGDDTLSGGDDDDVLQGGDGNDVLNGDAGSDTMWGGDGDDTLDGGDGDDDIEVGGGDVAEGGSGDDVFTIDETDDNPDVDITLDGGSDGTDGNAAGPENGDEGDILDLSDVVENLSVELGTDPESGTVDGLDGDGTPDITFTEIEKILTGIGNDVIDGGAATGPIDADAGAGDDTVGGGTGDDTLAGGDGNDELAGGAGNDVLDGDAGDDLLDGGDGDDVLQGGDGTDTLVGGAGADTLDGGANDDDLVAGAGDTAQGDAGDDEFTIDSSLPGGATITIVGGEADEEAVIDPTNNPLGRIGDTLDLSGLDVISVTFDATDPTFDPVTGVGESGTVVFNNDAGDPVTINFSEIENVIFDPLPDGVVDGLDIGEVMGVGYTDPEGDQITDGADVIEGNGGDDTIDAGLGDDTVDGGTGDDEIDGNGGDDVLAGGAGQDTLDGGIGSDTLDGGADDDLLDGGDGDDVLAGGLGDDALDGGTGNDDILGGDGSDTLAGGDGADTLDGGDGDDDIAVGGLDEATGGAGDDVFTIDDNDGALDLDIVLDGGSDGTDGNPAGPENGDEGDILDLGDRLEDLSVELGTDPESGTVDGLDGDGTPDITFSEIEKILTGSGDDTIDGSDATSPIDVDSGSGNDEVIGGLGDDTIATGEDDDVVEAGAGNDSVDGGSGTDDLDGGAGDDTLSGGTGADTLDGGLGADLLDGGEDDDNLTLASSDTGLGGGGDDVFQLDPASTEGPGTITIVGGETDEGGADTTNDNFPGAPNPVGDVLDLRGLDVVSVTYDPTDPTFDPVTGVGESGTIVVNNSAGDPVTIEFSEIENVLFDPLPDGVVDGEETGEVMDLGYDDSNAPTDGGGDVITNGADVIAGNGGDDTIDAGSGDDTVDGGTGNDSIIGGFGDDDLAGDEGDDSLFGGSGNDTLDGGDGNDLLVSGSADGTQPVGDPTSNDGPGNANLVNGGDGNDTILASVGPDTLNGDAGDDVIIGNGGDDLISGGTGSDTLDGEDGVDTVDGGAGDDDIVLSGGDTGLGGAGDDEFTIDDTRPETGTITIVGGEADEEAVIDPTNNPLGRIGDTLDLSGLDLVSVTFDPTDPTFDPVTGVGESGTVVFNNAAGDPVTIEFSQIENVVFDPLPDGVVDGEETGENMGVGYDDSNAPNDGGGDVITEGADVIDGNGGDDTINAGGGNDTVDGGEGNDTVNGNDGDDLLDGGAGDDLVTGGLGDDTVLGGAGNDVLRGNVGNDSLEGGDGNDELGGAEDNDTLQGGAGLDTLTGGSGDDVLDGGADDDTLNGGSGNDEITDLEGDNLVDSGIEGLPDLGFPFFGNADTAPGDDRDTVITGAGDDTISTGDDADVIDAGDGNNVIDGGFDDDDITSGSGADLIVSGEGSDTISSGDGDDTIFGGIGGIGGDSVNLIDDNVLPFRNDPILDNGDDLIDAGAGNDLVFGEDDNDTILGGAGDDTLDGGIDDDVIEGGAGNDVIIGGQGADSLSGGEGNDTFTVGLFTDPVFGDSYVEGAGDTIIGGEDPGDGDTDVLDLSGAGPLKIVFDDAVDPTGTPGESGTVTFFTDTTQTTVAGTLTFSEIENVIPCFTPGSLIATPRGEVPVETLREGDKVITRDNGIQEIRWVGSRTLGRAEFAKAPNLKPILVKTGALGHGLPERDMLVSPQHRMLVTGSRTQLYFDESEVLVAAKHLVNHGSIQTVDTLRTTYIHFMFDRHEVVLSDGAWTESFQPGDQTLGAMGQETRDEIVELFPELATAEGITDYTAARRALKAHEAKLLQL